MTRYSWPLTGQLVERSFGDRKIPFVLTDVNTSVAAAVNANTSVEPQTREHFYRSLFLHSSGVYEFGPSAMFNDSNDVSFFTASTRNHRFSRLVRSAGTASRKFGWEFSNHRRRSTYNITGWDDSAVSAVSGCTIAGSGSTRSFVPSAGATSMTYKVSVPVSAGDRIISKLSFNNIAGEKNPKTFVDSTGALWTLSGVSVGGGTLPCTNLDKINDVSVALGTHSGWALCTADVASDGVLYTYTKGGTGTAGTGTGRLIDTVVCSGTNHGYTNVDDDVFQIAIDTVRRFVSPSFLQDPIGYADSSSLRYCPFSTTDIAGFAQPYVSSPALSTSVTSTSETTYTSEPRTMVFVDRNFFINGGCNTTVEHANLPSPKGAYLADAIGIVLRLDEAEELCHAFGDEYRGERCIWLLSLGNPLREGVPAKGYLCFGKGTPLVQSAHTTDDATALNTAFGVTVRASETRFMRQFSANYFGGRLVNTLFAHGIHPCVSFFKPNEFFGGSFSMAKGLSHFSSLDRRSSLGASESDKSSLSASLKDGGNVAIEWMYLAASENPPDIFVEEPEFAAAIAAGHEGELREQLIAGVPLGKIRDSLLTYGPARLLCRTYDQAKVMRYKEGTLSFIGAPLNQYNYISSDSDQGNYTDTVVVTSWPSGDRDTIIAEAEAQLGLTLITPEEAAEQIQNSSGAYWNLSRSMRWIYFYFVDQRVVDLCNVISVFGSVREGYVVDRV